MSDIAVQRLAVEKATPRVGIYHHSPAPLECTACSSDPVPSVELGGYNVIAS